MSFLSSFFQRSAIEKAGMLIGFLVVENVITVLPNVGSLYYAFLLAALLYMLMKERVSVGLLPMLGLYAVCLISLLVNDVPAVFRPYPRFLTYLMLTLLVSPAINNESFTRFRSQVFVTILKLLKYVVVASVIYAMMGGGYGMSATYFQGVTNHSMMLGPLSAVCALYTVYSMMANSYGRKQKVWHALILLLSLFCLLQAASRTAFLGTIVSMAVFFAVYYRNSLGKYLKTVIAVSVVLALSMPLWVRYMDKLEEKNSDQKELNMSSREEHWKQRLKEFRGSPFWGIGFVSVDVTSKSGSIYSADGKVETGSSWLCILSMTGLFGFAAFLAVFLVVLKRAWQIWSDTPLLSALFVSVLCFVSFHMSAEGYVYSCGALFCIFLWLLFGVIYGATSNKDWAYELQQKLAE